MIIIEIQKRHILILELAGHVDDEDLPTQEAMSSQLRIYLGVPQDTVKPYMRSTDVCNGVQTTMSHHGLPVMYNCPWT